MRTDRQTDRQADRQAGRQTDRQTGRQADRQADRQTGRQADRRMQWQHRGWLCVKHLMSKFKVNVNMLQSVSSECDNERVDGVDSRRGQQTTAIQRRRKG